MICSDQKSLFEIESINNFGIFPSTRYQGSKNKILDWIYYSTERLTFNTVLDAFGGTGSVDYAFKNLFKKFQNSILVISYRDDGIPTTKELVEILKKMGKEVEVKKTDYKYVLSNGKSREVLIISQ